MFDKDNIEVLNYSESEVFVDTSKDSYRFGASRDGIVPSINILTLGELQNIHSNTQLISTGWLMFDEEIKAEIYEALRIHDWKNILTNDDIKDIILNPTIEGLQKIIDIKHIAYFDRIRAVLFKLEFNGYEVTTKVKSVIEARYLELQNRQRNSLITLAEKEINITPKEVQEFKAENDKLRAEMLVMQKQMADMMATIMATNQETVTEENAPKIIQEAVQRDVDETISPITEKKPTKAKKTKKK